MNNGPGATDHPCNTGWGSATQMAAETQAVLASAYPGGLSPASETRASSTLIAEQTMSRAPSVVSVGTLRSGSGPKDRF
jgi:hypothetical protein